MDDVSGVRRDYQQAGLDERDVAPHPIAQFRAWLAEALAADPLDPTAMTLATADREGRPSARIVLLKGYDERGFVFFTNYGSRKACELLVNPHAALVFYWPAFDRQVRAEGTVGKVSRDETAAYFATRPLGSQLGAWASRQSAPVAGREDLERAMSAAAERFAGREVPAPDFWGGYRLSPTWVEFWQGRESRLHDRLVYRRDAGGAWTIQRLQP
ncbi:MAG TPA: pyridoxamine 5'-phosphate oxidase [Thermoanaerobaculia bacterium]|nr:pyridoxamine 5'-phosphate oxidase [Thermoanaerobaculia bacterium]